MKRLMIFAVAAAGFGLASCSKSDLQTTEQTGRPNELAVQVSLSAEPLSRPSGAFAATKATATEADEALTVDFGGAETKATTELTSAEDSKVQNIWAIQFKENGTLLGTPYYTADIPTPGAGSAGIDATYALSVNLTTNTETGGKVYFIANTNSPTFFNTTNAATEAKLKEVVKAITSEFKPTASSGIPMLGVYTGAVSSSSPISNPISMKRLMAKVILKYKVNSSFAGFEVTSVQLRNAASNIYFGAEPTTGIFPAKATGSHVDYAVENPTSATTDGAYKKFVWYVPENLRNTISGITSVGDRILSKTDGNATYIEIKGTTRTSSEKYEKVSYQILLGDPTTNAGDFNVRRNNVYTVTVDIQGTNAADKRIAVESFDLNNSAMLVPSTGTVTFDIRKCLNNKFTTAAQLQTMLTNKAWRVAVLWQDVAVNNYVTVTYNEPNLADDKSLGLFTVKSNSATAGNAVVALYDNATTGGTILWSWHIWVTTYHPDGSQSYNLGINSKASVPGGEVHTYGEKYKAVNGSRVIMDRNLGATATSNDGTIPSATVAPSTFGFLYQWGRKDPLPRWSGSGATEDPNAIPQTLYNAAGTAISGNMGYNTNGSVTTTPIATATNSGNSLAYSVKNPVVLITSEGLADWYAATENNQDATLWGSNAAKGAYDPCPKGWQVVPNGTWNDFGNQPYADPFWYYTNGVKQVSGGTPAFSQNVRNGRLYSAGNVKAWYPGQGVRSNTTGSLHAVGYVGYYWSSTAQSTKSYYLYFGNSWTNPDQLTLRAFAYPVRCIQE